MEHRAVIYDLLDVKIGNMAVRRIQPDAWGSMVIVECLYSYPPEEKPFTLIFKNCRAIQWYVLKSADELKHETRAQVMTHDLGQGNYQRTARIATVLMEVIISYGELVVEKAW